MCWRDNHRPPSREGIAWAIRWNEATRVKVGDSFTFGPLSENRPSHIVFHRILKDDDDAVGKTDSKFHNGTEIKFTHGPFHHKKATIKLHWKYHLIRIKIQNGPCLYPFQTKRPYANNIHNMRFTVISLPTEKG